MADMLMIGSIKVERTADGDRKLTHPSGVVALETARQLADMRAALVKEVSDAQARVTAFDAQAAKEAVLTPVAVEIGD
jgi:hypothetical protein